MSSRHALVCGYLAILSSLFAAGAAGNDIDGDGVDDAFDVCPNTPSGILVDTEGRPLANFDADCDVDLRDFAILQIRCSGLDDLALLVANLTGALGGGRPVSESEIELRYVLRRQPSEEATACALPSSETAYLQGEGSCFLMEIYATDTSPNPLGITCVFFDVDLGDAACPLSGTSLLVEGIFSEFRSGSLEDPHRADEVGGCTLEAGIGVGEWVLVATIDIAVPQIACCTAVTFSDAETASSLSGNDGPVNVGFGEPSDINIRCPGVIYDLWPLDGDGFIDAADLSMLTPCMGRTPPFGPNCERTDWNCDGKINEEDRRLFDTAWQKGTCAGGIEIPACQLSCR